MRAAGLDGPRARAAWRLATARTLAWALLLGAWILYHFVTLALSGLAQLTL